MDDEITHLFHLKYAAPEGEYAINVSVITIMGLSITQIRGLAEVYQHVTGRDPRGDTIGEMRSLIYGMNLR